MKAVKKPSNWSLTDVIVAVITWGIAIALLYTVVIKLRILINN